MATLSSTCGWPFVYPTHMAAGRCTRNPTPAQECTLGIAVRLGKPRDSSRDDSSPNPLPAGWMTGEGQTVLLEPTTTSASGIATVQGQVAAARPASTQASLNRLTVSIPPNISPLGVRAKSWTGLCRHAESLSVFERAERAMGDLDALLVVPADVGVEDLNELPDGCGLPVPRIEPSSYPSLIRRKAHRSLVSTSIAERRRWLFHISVILRAVVWRTAG